MVAALPNDGAHEGPDHDAQGIDGDERQRWSERSRHSREVDARDSDANKRGAPAGIPDSLLRARCASCSRRGRTRRPAPKMGRRVIGWGTNPHPISASQSWVSPVSGAPGVSGASAASAGSSVPVVASTFASCFLPALSVKWTL
jgi:hypothetical protein